MEKELKRSYFAVGIGFILGVVIVFSTTFICSMLLSILIALTGIPFERLE